MAQVTPRWEWRTFGEPVRLAEGAFAASTPEQVQETDEVYLLSEHGGDTVKVRGGLMDVKHLVQVQEHGLEQWTPTMKAPFPLGADDVRSFLAALGTEPAAPLTRGSYSLEELQAEVVEPHPHVVAVPVHKLRRRFTMGGCMAELTDVRTPHGTTRTIAVEAEDPDDVVATVRDLGLESYPNTSFPRGLQALGSSSPADAQRYAVIDVGTNSVKFHIGELTAGGQWRTVVDRAASSRLGEGLAETGRLSPAPIQRTVDAIAEMTEEARQHGVAAIAAVGTAGLRMAPNSAELLDAVAERCQITIEIVPGEEEGRLAYLAARAGLGGLAAGGSVVVFDTGGGSSQFTFGHGDRVEEQFSVPVGAVRFTERYGLDGAVSDSRLHAALEAIDADLARLAGRPTPEAVVGMGGAVTNLAAVKLRLAAYDPDLVQGTVLHAGDVDEQLQMYRTRTAAERAEIVGLQPQRADIILAGCCIVRTVLAKLGADRLTVSDRGLRHGLLVDRFG